MLQVDNQTPFAVSLTVFPDARGVETAYAVAKATFTLTPAGPQLQLPPAPLLATDVYWGEPAASSLRAAGEMALLKPATDVLVTGHAVAPTPDTRVADVGVMVGPVRRIIRVFGDRCWDRGLSGWHITEPAPWQRMPLRWEWAYGGVARAPAPGEAAPHAEFRNPVGRGHVGPGLDPEVGMALPNLEDPQALISHPHDSPAPAAMAPVAPTWLPRRLYAGTYDEAWTQGRAPYLPLDFDARYFHVAPPEMIAPGFLQGGEPVRLLGLTPEGRSDFVLPHCGLQVSFQFRGQACPGAPQLETVLIEPDVQRLQMLWRCALPVDKHLLKLKSVRFASQVWGPDGRPASPLQGLGRMPGQYAPAGG